MWNLSLFLLVLPVLLFSLTIHEYSHGLVAYILGDPTPKRAGRLTLNPLKHLDFFGTLTLILTQAIGWAKPVPINPNYFKNPWRDMALTSAAGPLSNLLSSLLFAFLYHLFNLNHFEMESFKISEPLSLMFLVGVKVNLGLAIFNFLPIPPLDGSKILAKFLPVSLRADYLRLELFGFLIIFFLAITGLLGKTLYPLLKFLTDLILGVTGLLFS